MKQSPEYYGEEQRKHLMQRFNQLYDCLQTISRLRRTMPIKFAQTEKGTKIIAVTYDVESDSTFARRCILREIVPVEE